MIAATSAGGTVQMATDYLRVRVSQGWVFVDGLTVTHSPGAQFQIVFRPGVAGWLCRRLVRELEVRDARGVRADGDEYKRVSVGALSRDPCVR